MSDKLCDIGFQQSPINECTHYHNGIIFIVYVEDGLLRIQASALKTNDIQLIMLEYHQESL
ncbi:hypothetical protein ACHAW6_014981 [Cyclotella cf. meneghiniana]